MSVENNPLLHDSHLPLFDQIQPEHVAPALDHLLAEGRQAIAELTANGQNHSWQSLVAPLEELDDRLEKMWSPVSHLNAVTNTPEWRDAYNQALPKLTQYMTERGQNEALYQAYQAVAENAADQLDQAQQTALEHALRDFKLAGVALSGEQKQQFAENQSRLSQLSTEFANHVLDATQGWSKRVESEQALAGLPETALQLLAQNAKEKGESGYRLTLDIPAYLPVMQYADDRELRRELYQAYTTRASELGSEEWDNSPLMAEIVALRQQQAELLGFASYAERSVATKMAESSDQVVAFLNDLAEKSLPVARSDYQQLVEFAREQHNLSDLQAWDIPYYSEKLRLAHYDLSQEQLRPYFPVARVIEGLFAITGKLFDIQFQRDDSASRWHRDVEYYQVLRDGQPIASFYFDLFAREQKRGGAWMADCRVRRRCADGSLQLPVAFLTCNFSPATEEKPALLTHDEVTTLFHEFGHGLHHMLTQVECAAVSGINGVAWDAVELPSQFLENWCWDSEAIPLISAHYESGEPLPAELLEKMLAAKNFQAGMQMVRQLEFALFDMQLHRGAGCKDAEEIQTVLNGVREQVAVYPVPEFNRFQHSFSHIFAGGYAAGYYSYKWAEVLSADAFSRFEEEGIFSPAAGRAFLTEILEQGGSREALELFIAFRGREPSSEALLRHSGMLNH